jgi:aspartate aminotransferase
LSSESALEVFARARELERAGRSIIHLELGEPEFYPTPPVIAAASEALAAGRDRYGPSEGILALREAVAEYLARTRNLHYRLENVLIAPGCKMALLMCLLAVIEAGSEVLYPDPGFPMYASVTQGLGAVPVPYRLLEANRFQPDVNEIASKISPRTRVLLLNSPGNPTGTVYERPVLEALADLARRHDLWVLSDEIYARIIYGGAYESIAALPGMAERTLVVDGFSKSFGMTGWRLGYAVAPPSVISALTLLVINSYSCVLDFLQCGAIEALRHAGRCGGDGCGIFPPPRLLRRRLESHSGVPLQASRWCVLRLDQYRRHRTGFCGDLPHPAGRRRRRRNSRRIVWRSGPGIHSVFVRGSCRTTRRGDSKD